MNNAEVHVSDLSMNAKLIRHQPRCVAASSLARNNKLAKLLKRVLSFCKWPWDKTPKNLLTPRVGPDLNKNFERQKWPFQNKRTHFSYNLKARGNIYTPVVF
jgi:hypothetical protein